MQRNCMLFAIDNFDVCYETNLFIFIRPKVFSTIPTEIVFYKEIQTSMQERDDISILIIKFHSSTYKKIHSQ